MQKSLLPQLLIATLVSGLFFLHACSSSGSEGGDDHGDDETRIEQGEGEGVVMDDGILRGEKYTLTPVKDSPEYADAELSLASTENADGAQVFDFEVANYVLGEQTADAAEKGMANSGKGQHIHLILNNGPYSAHYDADFSKELEDGHYVMLAFLSRSYHESVKAETAAVVSQFDVGGEVYEQSDLSGPHMFYSRPKGTYKGADTEKLLLDFYLHHVILAEGGFTVRATVNEEVFTITEWQPYAIEGLEMGEVKIQLELLDPDGNLVESPFNPVNRTVTLAPADPE